MVMNISSFLPKKDESQYPGSLKRGNAAMIDMLIVLLLRSVVAQFLGILFVNDVIKKFLLDFKEKFGTDSFKNIPTHVEFMVNHEVFSSVIMFYLIVIFVGALYYAYFNSSAWQATLGKRAMKIVMTKDGADPKVSFGSALSHYLLSVLPFVYIFYLVGFKTTNHLSFFTAVTSNPINILLGVIFVVWVQIHTITKRKTTAYDMICGTTFVKGRTTAKFPWNKVYAEDETVEESDN